MDEISPRRPQDPPWRSRIAHRTSTPEAMAALRQGRLRRGWSITEAAQVTNVSRPHISLLERGLRRPSESVAEALIDGYFLDDWDADAVRSIARRWVGRDSPYRTGVSPPDPEQHFADPGAPRETLRPVASAEAWIAWARRKTNPS